MTEPNQSAPVSSISLKRSRINIFLLFNLVPWAIVVVIFFVFTGYIIPFLNHPIGRIILLVLTLLQVLVVLPFIVRELLRKDSAAKPKDWPYWTFSSILVALSSILIVLGPCSITIGGIRPGCFAHTAQGIVLFNDDVILTGHPGCPDSAIAFGSMNKDHKSWLFQELSKRGTVRTVAEAPNKTIWCLIHTWFGNALITGNPSDHSLKPVPLPLMNPQNRIICLAASDDGPILLCKYKIYFLKNGQWLSSSWQYPDITKPESGAPSRFKDNGGRAVVIPQADYILLGAYDYGGEASALSDWCCVNIHSGKTFYLERRWDKDINLSRSISKKMPYWCCNNIAIGGNTLWCTALTGYMTKASVNETGLLSLSTKDLVSSGPTWTQDLIYDGMGLTVDMQGRPWLIQRDVVYRLNTEGKFIKMFSLLPYSGCFRFYEGKNVIGPHIVPYDSLRLLDNKSIIVGCCIATDDCLSYVYGNNWWRHGGEKQDRARFTVVSQDDHSNWTQTDISCPDSLYVEAFPNH